MSALAVTATAAPTEIVAGRVVTHAVPSLHIVQAAPAVTAVRLIEQDPIKPHAQYNFGYSITDSVTGDSKTRQESRDGDVVTGSYSVADPDGRIRTVTYTADDVHGFQATVTYDGQEGPVAIPFNAPATAVVRSEPIQVAVASAHPAAGHGINNAVTAVRSVPTVRARPFVHTIHNLGNAVTSFRSIPSFQAAPAVHQFHDLGQAVTSVRTVPHVQALHNLAHSVTAVRTLPAVTAFRHYPAVHAFHSAQPLHLVG